MKYCSSGILHRYRSDSCNSQLNSTDIRFISIFIHSQGKEIQSHVLFTRCKSGCRQYIYLVCFFCFQPKTCNSLWVFMVVDVTLWIMILICFITIFSGGGLFLLLVFLLGTAIRAYITFMLHEYMIEESKTLGNNVESQNKVETTPQPRHLISSPIPEESTIVEQYSAPESTNQAEEEEEERRVDKNKEDDERRKSEGEKATVQKEVTWQVTHSHENLT
jgi:hypothetical protein